MSKNSNVNTTSNSKAGFTVPGLTVDAGHTVALTLQKQLHALNSLHLTLKHAHWNVIGPGFIAVHEMLDPQVDLVRGFVDELAERMATLGVSPNGLPGALVADRTGGDYEIHRAGTQEHIAGLDVVYQSVVAAHRDAIAAVGDVDPISEDLLIAQTRELEQFQWFLRAHLEDAAGHVGTVRQATPLSAAKSA
ncbi:Dps family protein [Humidisolicoccus flavus]|uniref:Dps family protein n=1 Tax=Humidisolicoccus flavus TaxID=3111414 RepID=UPI00324722BF